LREETCGTRREQRRRMSRHIDQDGVVSYDGFFWQLGAPAAALPFHYGMAAATLSWAVTHTAAPWVPVACAALGVLTWTLFEYAMHRWLMHQTRNPLLRKVWIHVHRDHHMFRRMHDPGHRSLNLLASAPMALLMSGVALALGAGALGGVAGWLLGYAVYETVHWLHHTTERTTSRWVERRRASHLSHHFQQPKKNFGFVTSLWDRVFGTWAPTDLQLGKPSHEALLSANER
jgi:sterol desaturase/sphingolipid hydroxylase (fatty acid hydroxylase superfamily)